MKVDLLEVHKTVLTLQKKNALVKKEPGFRHYPTHLYEEKFGGALAVKGYLSKGHRSWNMDGVEGVLVPDEAVTKLQWTEEIAITMNEDLGSTEAGHSAHQLDIMQGTMYQSFWNESSRGLGVHL